MSDYESRVISFKNDIKLYSPTEIVHKHIIEQQPFAISAEDYYKMKVAIADYWGLHYSQIIMVGSGKLGFSLKNDHTFRQFNKNDSDLDIAIISRDFFDTCWSKAFEYANNPGVFWNKCDRDSFMKYIFIGWVRPDMFPNSSRFKLRKKWWSFFRNTLPSNFANLPYQINAALYRDWNFFESYHTNGIIRCKGLL